MDAEGQCQSKASFLTFAGATESAGSELLIYCRLDHSLHCCWSTQEAGVQTTGILRQGQMGKLQVAYKPSRVPPDLFKEQQEAVLWTLATKGQPVTAPPALAFPRRAVASASARYLYMAIPFPPFSPNS